MRYDGIFSLPLRFTYAVLKPRAFLPYSESPLLHQEPATIAHSATVAPTAFVALLFKFPCTINVA